RMSVHRCGGLIKTDVHLGLAEHRICHGVPRRILPVPVRARTIAGKRFRPALQNLPGWFNRKERKDRKETPKNREAFVSPPPFAFFAFSAVKRKSLGLAPGFRKNPARCRAD